MKNLQPIMDTFSRVIFIQKKYLPVSKINVCMLMKKYPLTMSTD